ncbi:hypothetical protein TRVL_10153 [Trypanosoma vivax]|nr:hypothetical protein TRVL_10153 [Trypanosoma vivax]
MPVGGSKLLLCSSLWGWWATTRIMTSRATGFSSPRLTAFCSAHSVFIIEFHLHHHAPSFVRTILLPSLRYATAIFIQTCPTQCRHFAARVSSICFGFWLFNGTLGKKSLSSTFCGQTPRVFAVRPYQPFLVTRLFLPYSRFPSAGTQYTRYALLVFEPGTVQSELLALKRAAACRSRPQSTKQV